MGCQSTATELVYTYCDCPERELSIQLNYDSNDHQYYLSDSTETGETNLWYWQIDTGAGILYSRTANPLFPLTQQPIKTCVTVYDTLSRCSAAICDILNKLTTNFKDLLSPSLPLSVYPNPASEVLHLQWEGIRQEISLQLYSILGDEIWSKKERNADFISIPVNSLNKGVYFLKISILSGQTAMRKIEIIK